MNSILTEELFCEFLVRSWSKTQMHRFDVSRSRIQGNSLDEGFFEVNSLEESFRSYTWNSADYSANKINLERFQVELRRSLDEGDVSKTRELFLDIYMWGGVKWTKKGGAENRSGAWLRECFENETLVAKIQISVQHLVSGQNLTRFNGQDLIMNSGFTKVASLASSSSHPLIIFDGRVGAALGHLVSLAMDEGNYSDLAASLLFPWGGARTKSVFRNPSNKKIKFPSLFAGKHKHKHYNHAKAVHNSSRIVNHAA